MNCLEKLLVACFLLIAIAWLLDQEPITAHQEDEAPKKEKALEPRLPKAPVLPKLNIKEQEHSFLQELVLYINPSDYPYASQLMEAAEYDETFIRRVRQAINTQNSGAPNLGQICDIYDYLYNHKIPIGDPINGEYFCRPLEYWQEHRGDCDDMAICLSAACESIGILTRIVLAFGKTGHAYTEVCLGKKDVKPFLTYLYQRYPNARIIHPYRDKDGYYWLNLDLNYANPGGSYFKGERLHYYYPSIKRWQDL